MIIGCPKEIKANEYRVGLTPASVREYCANGHQVIIETQAGLGIGADDKSYQDAGAKIASSAEQVFQEATMIVKVKEPQEVEWKRLNEDHILYTYLHLAPDPKQTQGLLDSGCAAVAYETITHNGALPLLAPMSEVAGRLSIQAAARCLEKENQGRGLLLGGVPGVEPAKVSVIGGGMVGLNAIKMAVGMGADVAVLDRSLAALRHIDDIFGNRVKTVFSNAETLSEHVLRSDVVIGSVLIPGATAPKLVTKAMIESMESGACVVDVAIDQGGCFATSRPTTHADPTYLVDEVVHYCVANMPGAVPRTSTYALNNVTLPYGLRLANQGLKALTKDSGFMQGLNVYQGKVTNLQVAESLNLDYVDVAAEL